MAPTLDGRLVMTVSMIAMLDTETKKVGEFGDGRSQWFDKKTGRQLRGGSPRNEVMTWKPGGPWSRTLGWISCGPDGFVQLDRLT